MLKLNVDKKKKKKTRYPTNEQHDLPLDTMPVLFLLLELQFRILTSAFVLLPSPILRMEASVSKFSGSVLRAWNSLVASSFNARAWKTKVHLVQDTKKILRTSKICGQDVEDIVT